MTSDGSDLACPVNLRTRGRRQRAVVAVAMGLVLVAGLVLLVTQDVPRAARLLLALPLFVGSLGLFQAQAAT